MEDQTTQTPVQKPVVNPVPAPLPSTNPNWLIIIFSVILLILLASTAFLGYQNYQLRKQINALQSPSPSPTPIATPDPTADWKTYIDNKIGFSLKYPSEWSYKLGETNATTGLVTFDTNLASGNKNTNYIFEIALETEVNLNQWSKYSTTTTLEPQIINGLNFEKYVVADMYYSLDYILKQNGKIIRFLVYPYDSSQYPIELKTNIDQIFSTFKFTD